MTDLIEAYTDARNRLVALVTRCTDDELSLVPLWSFPAEDLED